MARFSRCDVNITDVIEKDLLWLKNALAVYTVAFDENKQRLEGLRECMREQRSEESRCCCSPELLDSFLQKSSISCFERGCLIEKTALILREINEIIAKIDENFSTK